MKAMILAAGIGSRLDPLTRNTPKPLVRIVNRPVMEYLIELLKHHGIEEIIVNLYYLGYQIEEYFGDGSKWGVKIHWAREDQLWGDAGSVKRLEDFLKEDTFIVIGGDDLTDMDLTELVDFHRTNGALATLALSCVQDPSEFGIVLLDNNAAIMRFLEKPKQQPIFSNMANTGVYVFEPEVFSYIPENMFYLFGKQLFPTLLEKKARLYGYLTHAYWNDIGNLKVYKQAQHDVLCGRMRSVSPLRQLSPCLWLGDNVNIAVTAEVGRLSEGCTDNGEVVAIGNNVTIMAGARVLDNTVIGNNCIVEPGTTLKDCILWEGAIVQQGTYLERCVVGKDCVVMTNAAIFDGIIVDPHQHNPTRTQAGD